MAKVIMSCVVTSHNNPEGLRHILNNLRLQCFLSYEVIILASDTDIQELTDIAMEYADFFDSLSVQREENKNDYGQDKRSVGLSLAQGEFVGFFNDDDEYSNDYLQRMIDAAALHNADLVYCNFNSHIVGGGPIDSYPQVGAITSGNFIVKTELAQRIGYNHRSYEADGLFIKDLVQQGINHYKLKENLYTHK